MPCKFIEFAHVTVLLVHEVVVPHDGFAFGRRDSQVSVFTVLLQVNTMAGSESLKQNVRMSPAEKNYREEYFAIEQEITEMLELVQLSIGKINKDGREKKRAVVVLKEGREPEKTRSARCGGGMRERVKKWTRRRQE